MESNWMTLKYTDVLREVESGDETAKVRLAWLKLSGLGGAETDEEGAVELLKERVKEEDANAMWMLAVCYQYGFGTEQQLQRAGELFDQSSERGNSVGHLFAHWGNKRGNLQLTVTPNNDISCLEKILPIVPLSELFLIYIDCDDEKTEKIRSLLMENTSLVTISLTSVQGLDGAIKMGESLLKNTGLTQLNMEANHVGIREGGAERIAESLTMNSALTTFYFGGNDLRDDGAKEISKMLRTNSTLTLLDLRYNEICGEGASFLCESLITNDTLTELNLRNNDIGDEGAKNIGNLLMKNTTLTTLNLNETKIGYDGVKCICDSLMTNSTLTELILTGDE